MAKLMITGVQHEASMEGLRGQGVPVFSKVALMKGDIVTASGEKASAVDKTKMAYGYAGWDTGSELNGDILANQSFRVVSEGWVQMDVAKAPGTKIYLSDTAGELGDVKGTEEIVVGVYIAEPENGDTASTALSRMAHLKFNLY